MALKLRLKIPSSTDFEHWFSMWFWLILLVLWFGVIGWFGWLAQTMLQAETVNPQLLSAKEVKLDQKTLTDLQSILEARAKRGDAAGVSPTRFSPGS